ncbi:MAG: hypothetical protein QXS85_04375 [Acidilobaceae archaeon]
MRLLAGRLEAPPGLLEEILGLHSALDAETGHFVCHSSPLRVVVAEASSRLVPLIQVSKCTYVTVGEDNAEALVEESGGETSLVVRAADVIEVGSARLVNRDVLEVVSGFPGYSMRVYSITLDGSPGALLVLRGEGSTVSVIALSCDEVEERREPLHV